MQIDYSQSLRRLAHKIGNGEKIRIGFGVIFTGVFPMAPVFEALQAHKLFDPFLVVLPDISRGFKHEREQYTRTKVELAHLYPNATLISPYKPDTKQYEQIAGQCDLWCTANPYDEMTHPHYGLLEFIIRGIPTFYTGYGMTVSQKYARELARKNSIFKNFWRIYTANKFEYSQLIYARPKECFVLSGYPKLDALANCEVKARNRKRIIIAPHHTVNRAKGNLNFSNFLTYSDYFMDLPARYPGVDFIFRPHPLLFTTLSNSGLWSQKKCANYIEKMGAYENVEVQHGGAYLETFANSDAIIHDCGSFIVEWLYTGKPGCYMIKDSSLDEYNDFAKRCFNAYSLAYSQEDISKFIDDVIMKGLDNKVGERALLSREVMCNFPNATQTIVNDITRQVLNYA